MLIFIFGVTHYTNTKYFMIGICLTEYDLVPRADFSICVPKGNDLARIGKSAYDLARCVTSYPRDAFEHR